ncbi:MAG: hypothetical protein JWM10_3636, partial [Myxococcaceae bacterium]|nr:hypothetical protein [Myxococcaceae bacterium]
AGGGATLYAVERPLPRAYLADRVRLVDDARARERLVAGDLLDGRTVMLRPDAGVGAREEVPVEGPGGCEITRYGDGEIDARCDAARAAVAVFVEQYAPGWRVTVDGREGRVLPVNGLMRGVALGPGTHRLALRYETPWLRASLALALAGWAVVAVLLVASRRRRVERAR